MRSFCRWRGSSKVGRIFFRGYQRCGLVGPKNVKLSFWESTKPLVAHPEPHRPLARGGAGFGTLAACTRLPGGHRAKTLTPLSMPAYPAFLLPTPFPKEFRLLSAFFPRSQPPRNGPSFPRKKFQPGCTLPFPPRPSSPPREVPLAFSGLHPPIQWPLSFATSRRGGLRTPEIGAGFHQHVITTRPPCLAPHPSDEPAPRVRQDVPRQSSGLAMRAHRLRPSETTTLHPILGLTP